MRLLKAHIIYTGVALIATSLLITALEAWGWAYR